MNDRSLSATSTCAYLCWIVGLFFVGAGFFHEKPWGTVGMPFICAGCVSQVRGFFISAQKREQAAFDFGREVGTAEVRPMRPKR
jgi:hypothetical protein